MGYCCNMLPTILIHWFGFQVIGLVHHSSFFNLTANMNFYKNRGYASTCVLLQEAGFKWLHKICLFPAWLSVNSFANKSNIITCSADSIWIGLLFHLLTDHNGSEKTLYKCWYFSLNRHNNFLVFYDFNLTAHYWIHRLIIHHQM